MINNPRNISIVLTGTIVPNVKINSLYNDPNKRKEEYLKCIKYYTQFSTVYFLENSVYPLEQDIDFQTISNLIIRKFPPSSNPERGKGFQEFKMLDDWVINETDDVEHFIKITGRYFYPNFADIWQECQQKTKPKIIISQHLMVEARVELFFTNRSFYKDNFLNLYLYCDERTGINVDTMDVWVYRKLKSLPKDFFEGFYSDTKRIGFAGTSGKPLNNHRLDNINYFIKRINYVFDKRYIWLSF